MLACYVCVWHAFRTDTLPQYNLQEGNCFPTDGPSSKTPKEPVLCNHAFYYEGDADCCAYAAKWEAGDKTQYYWINYFVSVKNFEPDSSQKFCSVCFDYRGSSMTMQLRPMSSKAGGAYAEIMRGSESLCKTSSVADSEPFDFPRTRDDFSGVKSFDVANDYPKGTDEGCRGPVVEPEPDRETMKQMCFRVAPGNWGLLGIESAAVHSIGASALSHAVQLCVAVLCVVLSGRGRLA